MLDPVLAPDLFKTECQAPMFNQAYIRKNGIGDIRIKQYSSFMRKWEYDSIEIVHLFARDGHQITELLLNFSQPKDTSEYVYFTMDAKNVRKLTTSESTIMMLI